MPFTDTLASVSGRNSRASNVSGATGASRSFRLPPSMNASNDTLANAGVLSMLKTSTDTGDIGALSFNSSRLPGVPARAQNRKQHDTKPCTSYHSYHSTHHQYAPSATSRVSSTTRDWDNASNGRQGSLTSMRTMPSYISEPHPAFGYGRMAEPQMMPSTRQRDSRSYSLTNAQLPRLKSEHSLKSQGREAQHYSGLPPSLPESRPPFVYPTRLKRPGYRSPSPALSDSHAQAPLVPTIPASMARSPISSIPRQHVPAYPPIYGHDGYVHEQNIYHGQPMSPLMPMQSPIGYPSQSQYVYRSAPMSPTSPVAAHHPGQRMPPPASQYPQVYEPQRSRPMPGYQTYQAHSQMYAQTQHRNPQQSNLMPIAHHMFHNAARMARQLPQRADTPMTEMSPPSSDPPSSGETGPSASSPPTPQDWTHLQVGVNPAFIDPSLTDLPESASDPVIPARYFDYIDGLDRAADDSEIESHHPSVPPSGFVQRVKAMLESKAAAEVIEKKDVEYAHDRMQMIQHIGARELVLQDHDHRVTIIEEFHAPAELPASPVKIAELEATMPSTKSVSHLTRELVKTEMATTITEDETYSEPEARAHAPVMESRRIAGNVELQKEAVRPVVSPFEDDTMQTADVPSSPPVNLEHQLSLTNSIRSSVAESSRMLTDDFALPLSVPEEDSSNLGETETESKDRFVLDADTITAQHQVMKESMSRLQSSLPAREAVSPLSIRELDAQYTEVSPLPTQTLGMDITMETAMGREVSRGEDMARSVTVESNPGPPAPRTPRAHSKSVNIPNDNCTPSDITSANRLSLPTDFTQTGTINMEASNEAMTDIAVRFSIPQASTNIYKPQIVHISSSSPISKEAAVISHAKHPSMDKKSKRGPVTFEDNAMPSRPHKTSSDHRHSKSSGSLKTKSLHEILHGYRQDQQQPIVSAHHDDINVPIASNALVRNKYFGPHLSDLKEESIEDVSSRDIRKSMDMTKCMQFQLPARIAAVKAMQERKQQEAEERAKLRDAGQYIHMQAGRPLAELRDLPSLNFSRTDLIDQLNEALNLHSIKAVEILRRRDLSPIYCPSPQRPQSTESLRDRYMSFFDRPEDSPSNLGSEDGDAEELAIPESKHASTASSTTNDSNRPLSPEEHMLQVATQVDRIPVPSVAGLSERLSELLPSLRNLHLGSILATDHEVAQTIDDIHNLGREPRDDRPNTVLSSRTSAGFRTLAERAEEIVRNGTHDSFAPSSRALRLNKNLPVIPGSASDDKSSPLLHGRGSPYLSGSASAPSGLGKEPARPCSALVKYRPPTSQEEVHQLLPPEMNPLTRASKRSMISGSKLTIDLAVPSTVHNRESTKSIVSRVRGTRSLDLTTAGTGICHEPSGIDSGSILTDRDPASSVTTERLTGINKANHSKQSKHSVLGSIKLRLTRGNGSEHPTKNTLSITRSVSDDHPHASGDRYPTTALSPPTGYNIDEVCSRFSDDSSDRDRRTAKGRRWTGLKGKYRHAVPHEQRASLDGNTESLSYDACAINQDRHGAS